MVQLLVVVAIALLGVDVLHPHLVVAAATTPLERRTVVTVIMIDAIVTVLEAQTIGTVK